MEDALPEAPTLPRTQTLTVVGLWALAFAAGIAVSGIGLTVGQTLETNPDANLFLVPALAAGAAVTAAIQARAIRRVVRNSEGWFGATFSGAVLAAVLLWGALLAGDALSERRWDPFHDLAAQSVGLLALVAPGYIQLRFLRPRVERAGIWPVATGVFAIAGVLCAGILFSIFHFDHDVLVAYVLAGLLYGAVMGTVLVRLAKRPAPTSTAAS